MLVPQQLPPLDFTGALSSSFITDLVHLGPLGSSAHRLRTYSHPPPLMSTVTGVSLLSGSARSAAYLPLLFQSLRLFSPSLAYLAVRFLAISTVVRVGIGQWTLPLSYTFELDSLRACDLIWLCHDWLFTSSLGPSAIRRPVQQAAC